MKKDKRWPLFRLIIPAFPEVNVYSRIAKKTTALGPIMAATAANKLWHWYIEVIDENNIARRHRNCLDQNGFFDHEKLQKERPAAVVGFYCGLSSTMERVWQTAKIYKALGSTTVAGSWHSHYMPEESLKQGIDIVVHGDGELVIQQILNRLAENKSIEDIAGISFLDSQGKIKTNLPAMLAIPDLDNLPFPDFGLLRYAGKIKQYPISRLRGCSGNCEFCSVKGKPRWASGQHLFDQVQWLVESRKAKEFFIVDDSPKDNKEGYMVFFDKIASKYDRSLDFSMQSKLEEAKDTIFLTAMKQAGVRKVCIGYESPMDEELKAMKKGYNSKQMLEWTKIFHNFGFWPHGMFIWGYPLRDSRLGLTPEQRLAKFKNFIKEAKLDTVQILRPIPVVGSDLRKRLEKENRIFPLSLMPWSKYDGNFVCHQPTDMSIRQLQEMPMELMRGFYRPMSIIRVGLKTVAMPIDWFFRGWEEWHKSWNKDIKHSGAYLLIRSWLKRYRKEKLVEKLEKFKFS